MTDLNDEHGSSSQDAPRHAAQPLNPLEEMRSAIIDRPSTKASALRSLYMLDAPVVENRLLRNLTQVAAPAVRCQIERDGALLPHLDKGINESDYLLFVTFNKLLIAPTLRLECNFSSSSDFADAPYLTLILEFHFCDYGKDGRRISSYAQADGKLSFTSHGATCSGFNNVRSVEHLFGPKEHEVVSLLTQYLEMGPAKQVVLKLYDDLLSRKELQDVRDVRARLPGGDKSLLISVAENREFDAVERSSIDLRPFCHASSVIPETFKAVMCPLESDDTFSTLNEACLQLSHSALLAYGEESEALRLWGEVMHSARLYRCGDMVVLAIMFAEHGTLDNENSTRSRFKLPKALEVKVTSGAPEALIGETGRLLEQNPGLPHHHAFFRIACETYTFREYASNLDRSPQLSRVKLVPHENTFAINAQMATVSDLRDAEQWHTVLLNQRTDELKHHDTTSKATMPDADRQALDQALRACKPWNAEQLQVIESVISAKGMLSVVLGTAGTGKTTLHKALGLYYWCLGYHVLSLAPANKDADHVAAQLTPEELRREFPGWDLSKFEGQFLRLFPGSKDVAIEDMNEDQAAVNVVGHQEGAAVSFRELFIALEEEGKVKGTVKEYSIMQALIRTAEHGGFPDGRPMGVGMSHHWAHLKKMIASYRQDKRTLKYSRSQADFRAYMDCKEELIRRNRFMVTTTGSVRSSEMVGKKETAFRNGFPGNWYKFAGGASRKGVIVLVDEATSDLEINVWSGIVCENWAHAVQGVFLFGDHKQLRPPNKSADRKIQYNYYLKRLDISLPNRLKREGWPCLELKEQYRMHACLSDFPNRMVYHGELRNGPVTHMTLDEVKPGLRAVLTAIITERGLEDDLERLEYQLEASDAKARLHWIEVDGNRVRDRAPWAVKEHTRVVLAQIMPKLCEYFKSRGEKTIDELMIVVAYNYAADLYKEGIRSFCSEHPEFSADDVPRVVTIDSSMGKEACMVIFDGSFQGPQVGFLSEASRVNVAITRCRDVLWIVGGRMNFNGNNRPTNLVQKYHDELEAAGHSHHFTAPPESIQPGGNDHPGDHPGGGGRGGVRGRGFRGGGHGRGGRGIGRGRGGRGRVGHRGGLQHQLGPGGNVGFDDEPF
ncbi:unnamed protein product [Zymoseptoria tritici ST99CH_1E4]|uniref:DNA2/NAM7 helicase-like C-terminal domain-containing protein n=1 Tax=Zymoseptoria tritici ST99CH_1E4 TaxID=1276532 RepID=A0A2H1GCJ0_ZYMTR|nr:unnamed protein product [Zymoseptoria tritici ST99CH_1E4]